jgi:hypothetical protein
LVCVNCLVAADCVDAAAGNRCDTMSGDCVDSDQSTSMPPASDAGGSTDAVEAEAEASSEASPAGDATNGGQ